MVDNEVAVSLGEWGSDQNCPLIPGLGGQVRLACREAVGGVGADGVDRLETLAVVKNEAGRVWFAACVNAGEFVTEGGAKGKTTRVVTNYISDEERLRLIEVLRAVDQTTPEEQ